MTITLNESRLCLGSDFVEAATLPYSPERVIHGGKCSVAGKEYDILSAFPWEVTRRVLRKAAKREGRAILFLA